MKKIVVTALLAAAAVFAPATPASAANGFIQPGDYMVAGNSACTLNFVFDGVGSLAGNVYLGTAAHCVTSIGQDVRNSVGQVWGDVAKIGTTGMSPQDWALIQVRTTFKPSVNPAVKGHPTYPTGYTKFTDTTVGDLIQISGHGVPFYMTTATQEERIGVMNNDTLVTQSVFGPITFGDSGGPLVHIRTGKAMGIVSQLGGGGTESGPTVEGILNAAANAGFPVALRTVTP